MKTKKSVMLAVIASSQILSLAAFAQSSSTSIPAAPSAATASAASQSIADAPAKPAINVNYTGFMMGPGLAAQNEGKTAGSNRSVYLNNRPGVQYNFSDSINAGIQPRFDLNFKPGKVDVTNDAWRLFANFKNVFKTDTLSLTIMPRVYLPTRNKSHDQKMLPSPELLPILSINPKNSRFSLAVYPQLIHFLYSDKVSANADAVKMLALGNFEGTYQLSGNTAITFGFYPEFVTQNDRATYNDSNELDLGFNWDFVKGWSVNPFVAMEFVGMGDKAPASKNMALNIAISGAIL